MYTQLYIHKLNMYVTCLMKEFDFEVSLNKNIFLDIYVL